MILVDILQGVLTNFFWIYLPDSSSFFQPLCFGITSKHRYLSTPYHQCLSTQRPRGRIRFSAHSMVGQPVGGAGQGDNRQVIAPCILKAGLHLAL